MSVKVERQKLILAVTSCREDIINNVFMPKILKLFEKYKSDRVYDLNNIKRKIFKPKFFFFKSDYDKLVPKELKELDILYSMCIPMDGDIVIQDKQYELIKDYYDIPNIS